MHKPLGRPIQARRIGGVDCRGLDLVAGRGVREHGWDGTVIAPRFAQPKTEAVR
jgi:hypothetical protein